MIDARPAHPAERALAIARELRATFALPAAELSWLLARWRDAHGVLMRDDALALVAQLVVTDGDRRPLTAREARDLTETAVRDCATLEDARGAVQRYAVIRGADAEQRARLDTLVRDTWHALHGAEVARAA
jgi:hypothetical protein